MMSAVLRSPPPTRWSDCSISDLNTLYDRNGDSCLFNSPVQSFPEPFCGNGIREGDEVCDCGSESKCTDDCCNPATCQLVTGAECSFGPCCTRECQLRSYGTECRGSTGECDVAEYCAGDTNECPVDDRRANGLPCNSDTGYCFDGACPSQASQCMDAFGEHI